MVSPEAIEAAAIPFIVGFAVGLALGRAVFGNLFVGVPIGIVLFAGLYWLRAKLVAAV